MRDDTPCRDMLVRMQNQADAMDHPGGYAGDWDAALGTPPAPVIPDDPDEQLELGAQLYAEKNSHPSGLSYWLQHRAKREHPESIKLHWQQCLDDWLSDTPYWF